MYQDKLEVVKQEMARVNIDILGISELNGLEWVNLTQMTIINSISVDVIKESKSFVAQILGFFFSFI